MYSFYIVKCSDGTLYSGIAADLRRRLDEHNFSARGAKYTKSRRPVALVYSKKFRSRSAALKYELKIKSLSRGQKLEIIKTHKLKLNK